MNPWVDDASDPASTSLAARHGRNALFGDHNCYTCHADYGMFGTITTKLGGLRHVYEYSLNYRTMPLDDFLPGPLQGLDIQLPSQGISLLDDIN